MTQLVDWLLGRRKPPENGVQGSGLTDSERISVLERRMDQLTIDWEDVLSKIVRRFSRDAARTRLDAVKALEGVAAAEPAAAGQPEAIGGIGPSKAQLWARARALGK